jgi:hypothetical protein
VYGVVNVRFNTNIGSITGEVPDRAKSQKAPSGQDDVWLDQSAHLDRSFATTPEMRPEVVQRGRQMIGDVTYPPDETIRKLAALLAMNMAGAVSESGLAGDQTW